MLSVHRHFRLVQPLPNNMSETFGLEAGINLVKFVVVFLAHHGRNVAD
jgi:hypothetical protein